MNEPFFSTDCPSCGAPVHAHSATTITLVCGYCNSLLVRQDNSLHDSGRDSALFESFSPLQIGTTGQFNGRGFALIGRLQARYEHGLWNEWHLIFDDGETGWLSEAGDLYVITQATQLAAPPATTDSLLAGVSTVQHQGRIFIAADIRDIELSRAAAEGELPFAFDVAKRRVADWRCENHFLTTDLGQDGQVDCYVGQGVALANLQLANLRTDAQIQATSGRLKGSRCSEACPQCGSPVAWLNGLTPTVICPSCGSDLDTSGEKATLRQANFRREAQTFTLPIGQRCPLDGKSYIVIGAVRQEELSAEDAWEILYGKRPQGVVSVGQWTEYLLFHPQAGFAWLVESETGWRRSTTLDVWPKTASGGLLQPVGSRKLYDYGGRVAFAAGAFYWHVRHGDVRHYSDFALGERQLCMERNRAEAAWSESVPVPAQTLREWFGNQAPPSALHLPNDNAPSKNLYYIWLAAFCIINFPAWLAMDGDNLMTSAMLTVAMAVFLYKMGGFAEDDD